MIDRVRNAGVLGYALVVEVDFSVLIYSNVLEESVALDSVVDIRLAFLVELDNLSVAATLVVEYALIVPAVLVVTDKHTLRVGRKGSLTGS